MYGPRSYHYEFISKTEWPAAKFLKVLKTFDIVPEDLRLVEPWIGDCYISFWCTRSKRELIEYVYRRYVNLEKLYLKIDEYQGNQRKLERDGYAII